jgi:hypothetical protein
MYSTYSQLDECLAKCHAREQTRNIQQAAEGQRLVYLAREAQADQPGSGFGFGAWLQWTHRAAALLRRRWKGERRSSEKSSLYAARSKGEDEAGIQVHP